eukprot:jgi/Bigna1/139673/aug1.51_g14381
MTNQLTNSNGPKDPNPPSPPNSKSDAQAGAPKSTTGPQADKKQHTKPTWTTNLSNFSPISSPVKRATSPCPKRETSRTPADWTRNRPPSPNKTTRSPNFSTPPTGN